MAPPETGRDMGENAVKWRITYEGPALDSHEMDVRELAPALLAVADAFDLIGADVLGGRGTVQVRVRGSFQTGSFAVDLLLVQRLATQLMDFLTSKPVEGLTDLSALVGMFYALFRFFRRKGHEGILRLERRAGQYVVVFKDGSEIEVEEGIIRLLQNPAVVDALRRVVAPLQHDGIRQVAFGTDREIQEVVTKEEAAYVTPLAESEEVLVDETRKMALSLLSVAFKENNKWRVWDGQTAIFVSMDDSGFLQRIEQGESFAKGDLLIGWVRVRQVNRDNRLQADYSVVEVLEHRHGPQQMAFPLETTDQDEES